jgi:hypothetical protein
VSVLAWMSSFRRSVAAVGPLPVRHAPSRGPAIAGPYVLLYNYLQHRYANRIVLTFAEVEDLLGFRLPDLARCQREWWTGAEVSSHSDAWRLANRSAVPNLLAQTVVFDRS